MSDNLIIYIIDDDDIYQFALRRNLNVLDLDKELLFFKDGEEAMDFLTENLEEGKKLPDIIFLDINMPIMDGFEFMEHFVQLRPRLGKCITVYMVSSSVDPADLKRAKAISEISDYLIKPVELEELGKLVLEIAEKNR